ncbi:hypothetical protein FORC17_1358 [Vibrio vulnificus]|nr:hypothetical protein FORC17_1358 [Vibrio vulnificus]HAS8237299.1 hypothetical protein [Vibrio vulnificus]
MYQEKILITSSGVLIGFFCTKLYDLYNNHRDKRNLKRCLLEEIHLVRQYLLDTQSIYENKLERKVDYHCGDYPRQLEFPIYKYHYADICLSLSYTQRASYQTIYSIVTELNDFYPVFFRKNCNDDNCENVCFSKLSSSYISLREAIYWIDNHLSHYRQPINKEQIGQDIDELRKEVFEYLENIGDSYL